MSGNNRKDSHMSIISTIKTAQKVKEKFKPVRKLTDSQMEYFDNIMDSREYDSWTKHDLGIATKLAQMMDKLDLLERQMASEDPVTYSNRGTPVANPVYSTTMQLTNIVQSLSRTLGLSAGKREVSNADAQKRAEEEARIKQAMKHDKEHDLL